MRFSKSARCALAVMVGLVFIGAPLRPTAAQEPYKAQIDALRKSLEKYKDYKVAVRDLYLSTVGCVHYAGEKMAHYMEYPKGAMGVHFINVTVRGAPDPMKPNVLIYEPVGKELKLVAVEWLVPLTPDTKKRPSLFGQPFMGPMEGHEPLIPKEYVHYDLHAWLFKNNPLGMFAPTNPDVNCEASDFFSARKADQDDAGAIERRGCLLLALSGHQLVRCLLLTQSGHHPVMPFPHCQGVGVAFLIRFDAFA